MTEDHPVIGAFVDGARQTLGTMAMMDMEVVGVESVSALGETLDYTATMGLCAHDGSEGLLLVSLCEEVARQVVASMLGADPAEIGDDLLDGVGEIANMVAGAAKTTLSVDDRVFDLSIPAVMSGAKQEVKSGGHGTPGARVDCEVGGKPLIICVWMEGVE